jgi:putative endonuclease
VTVHWTYVIECADGSLYTGYTTDLQRRVREHDRGEGAKYTRGRTPVELVYSEQFDAKSPAMSREYEIKQLSRTEKERLVAEAETAGSETSEARTTGASRTDTETSEPGTKGRETAESTNETAD